MSGFNCPITGDFDKYFMTTTELIDRYAQGGLWNWGYAGWGNLGDSTPNDTSSPVQTIASGTNWKYVACGNNHTAAIKTDGTLWLWGINNNGALGNSTTTNRSSPIQTMTGGTNWKQVACGYDHTAAIKTDGTLWTWGKNNLGQIGDSTVVPKSSPVQTIAGGTNWKQVACGTAGFTTAIKTDGTLWLWGYSSDGNLGDSTTVNKSSPVQTIAGGTNWKQVSAGDTHTTAIKTDGTLWSWGQGAFGQLGNSNTVATTSPVQTITGGTNWKQVSIGRFFTSSIKTDGTLWIWGSNAGGGLGDSTTTNRSSPVQTITGGTNWKQVSCGNSHTAATKTDGTLWSWGRGNGLGDSTNINVNKSSPVQTIAGGTNWKQVSAGNNFSAAVQYSDIGQVL